jgi:hypothetical protein
LHPGVVTPVKAEDADDSGNGFLSETNPAIPTAAVIAAALLIKCLLFADSIVDSGQTSALGLTSILSSSALNV